MVGRSLACHVILPHDSVSRRHASLSIAGSDVIVTDLGSRNGTFLDATPVQHAHVRIGQSLSFGAVACTLSAAPAEGHFDDEDETGSVQAACPESSTSILDVVSQAQRRVLERLLEGEPEKEIACALNLSVHTVHAHVRSIYRQLGVHSRAELMAKTLRQAR